jgi:hypothetical protein
MLFGKVVKVYAHYHILRTTHCVDKRQSSLISQPLVSAQYSQSFQEFSHANHDNSKVALVLEIK